MALDLMGYIEKSSKRPNRAILESLGASQELIEYLMETPGNTNWKVVEAIGGSSGGNPDCEHTDLGELMYCGSASNKAILDGDTGAYDEGLQEGYRNTEEWIRAAGEPPTHSIIGVFDGNIVYAEQGMETSGILTFGSYLTVTLTASEETGDPTILVSPLVGASHYAIYYCEDCHDDHYYSTLGTLYYCGGLQNGDIFSMDGTADVGVVVTDEQIFEVAIRRAAAGEVTMSLVSNGNTVSATRASENSVAFGNVELGVIQDPESGDPSIAISNAPAHYAIYCTQRPQY